MVPGCSLPLLSLVGVLQGGRLKQHDAVLVNHHVPDQTPAGLLQGFSGKTMSLQI